MRTVFTYDGRLTRNTTWTSLFTREVLVLGINIVGVVSRRLSLARSLLQHSTAHTPLPALDRSLTERRRRWNSRLQGRNIITYRGYRGCVSVRRSGKRADLPHRENRYRAASAVLRFCGTPGPAYFGGAYTTK